MLTLLKSLIKSAGRGIYHDPQVQKMMARHPRFFGFIKRRLTPDEQFGLYLTIGAGITILFVYLFFGVIEDIIGQTPLIQSDLRIIDLVQILRTPVFSSWMLLVTYLGKWQIVFLGAALVSFILILARRWRYLLALIISVGGSEIFVWLLAQIIHRSRPPLVNALAPETSYSFPSGHAFVAFSFYALIVYFIFRNSKTKIVKTLAVLGGLAVVLMIGFSRIYLGAHWPSDVLASYASGVAWLAAIITAVEIRQKFKPKITEPRISRRVTIFLSFICAILWSGYAWYFWQTNPLKPPTIAPTQPLITINESGLPDQLFNNLPKTSENITGKPMEPISLVVIAKGDQEFITAMQRAGWYLADEANFATIILLAQAAIQNVNDLTAPMTPSFWNAETHDLGFERPTDAQTVRERHHARFWRTPFVTADGSRVYVGTASLDIGIKWLITHKIKPDIDTERDFLFSTLYDAGLIDHFVKKPLVEPTLGKNFAGDQFFTDGKAYYLYLK